MDDTTEPKTISERQLAANRENAKESTGPKTEKGKTISSLNAKRRGFFAKWLITGGPPALENPAELNVILEGFRALYSPVGIVEDIKVQKIAITNWKEIRLERREAAIISEQLSAAVADEGAKARAERLATVQRGILPGSDLDPEALPYVTLKALRDQHDLVKRIRKPDAKIEDEKDFMCFVYVEESEDGEDPGSEVTVDERREFVRKLEPVKLEELKVRFVAQMLLLLGTMFEVRVKAAAHEAAIERSLLPDGHELLEIIKYSDHLMHREERLIAQLERLQAARRRAHLRPAP